MYYITNQTDQIIAIDNTLLELLKIDTLETFTNKILLDEISFSSPLENKISITYQNTIHHFISQESQLSSVLGEFRLIHLSTIEEINTAYDEDISSLVIPNTPDTSINEISIEEEISPIIIDIDDISKSIGISKDDYRIFLDEYMDTAINLEENLKSDTLEIRETAIETLMQLAKVLHLPKVNDIVSRIAILPSDKRIDGITTFYNTLSSITIEKLTAKNEIELFDTEINTDKKKNLMHALDRIEITTIKPIPFSFKISQAADELSLPEELIEEFIHDFIRQAHEETQNMLEAYENGDLASIQKIANLLKGTASNLRIHTLTDTLYDIQLCENPTQLKGFIIKYWGHFLSFEEQMNTLANKGEN